MPPGPEITNSRLFKSHQVTLASYWRTWSVVEQSTAEQRQFLDAKRERLALVEDQAQRIWRKGGNRFQKRPAVTRPNHELKQQLDVLRDTQQKNRALQQKTPGVATES